SDAPGLKERGRPARAGARRPAVAGREVFPSLRFGHLGGGVGEAQWLENVALDVVGVRHAAFGRNDLAGERQPKVRILKVLLGGIERLLRTKAGHNLLVRWKR